MILVTGVTGLIGRATAECLLDQGIALRGLARDAAKAADLRARDMEFVPGNMLDSEDMAKATAGVTAALLVTPNDQRQLEMEQVFARAAANSGVRHLVKISSIRAAADARAPFPASHFQSEESIRSLGMRWTMLRANFFLQNLLMYAPSIARSGTFTLPLGAAGIGMIDARDVAEIAARKLLDSGCMCASHDISGRELLDCHAVAARMSAVLGREIRYLEQTPADFRIFMQKVVPDPWRVNAMCDLFADIANDPLGPLTDETEQLLGRKPRSVEQFVADYAKAFMP